MPRALRRKWRRFRCLPRFERAWLLPAWLLLGAARAAILVLSFRRIAAFLGRPCHAHSRIPLVEPVQQARARQIARVIALAARYTPWQSNCFAQAVVARCLLGLHGIPYALCFGVMRDGASTGLRAHAWVHAGPVAVTGGRGFGQFTVVGSFVSRGRAAT